MDAKATDSFRDRKLSANYSCGLLRLRLESYWSQNNKHSRNNLRRSWFNGFHCNDCILKKKYKSDLHFLLSAKLCFWRPHCVEYNLSSVRVVAHFKMADSKISLNLRMLVGKVKEIPRKWNGRDWKLSFSVALVVYWWVCLRTAGIFGRFVGGTVKPSSGTPWVHLYKNYKIFRNVASWLFLHSADLGGVNQIRFV